MTSDTSKTKRRFLRDKPSKPAVAFLLLLLVAVLFSRDRIAELAALRGILDADAPDPAMIQRVADQRENPLRFLADIWRSGQIPHRWNVISYISRTAVTHPEIVAQTEPLLAEAARDRDLSVRTAALNLARIAGHSYWLPAAMDDLADPDDDVRLEALHTLHRGKATNALPAIIGRLEDPSPRIVSFAAGVIHNFTFIPRGVLATNASAAHSWLKDHASALSPIPNPPLHRAEPGPAYDDLTLERPGGEALPLASLKGRPVLLFFFATWASECTLEMAALKTLKSRLGDRIHLLAIGIDPNDIARQKHDREISARDAKRHVRRVAGLQRISEFLAFDPDNRALLRLEGMEIPVHVLLDSDLRLVRRFTGRRDATNLERIISRLVLDESAPSGQR